MWSCVSRRAQGWGAMSSPPSPGSAWESLASSEVSFPDSTGLNLCAHSSFMGKDPPICRRIIGTQPCTLSTTAFGFSPFFEDRCEFCSFRSTYVGLGSPLCLPMKSGGPSAAHCITQMFLCLLNLSWNLKSSGSGGVYHHQFSLKFLCLWGIRITEVSFSLTKQHPLLSLCYGEH